MTPFLTKLGEWFLAKANPQQICVLCLITTIGISYVVSTQYVRASELERVRTDIHEIAAEQLESKIIDVRILQCQAQNGAERFYQARVSELLRRYRERTAQTFTLPACSEL
jgi:hypothetical protein